jgi:CRP-like cAMP-binding protein
VLLLQRREVIVTIPGNIDLFAGINPEDLTRLLDCLDARYRNCTKGDAVIREGDAVDFVGVVLAGGVQVERTDTAGNRIILAALGIGAMFAESFVCAGIPRSPVSVFASQPSRLLFIPYARIIRPCSSACSFHSSLIGNMVRLVARRNLLLNERIGIIAKRTTREKIIAYLDSERAQAAPREDGSFDVRFSRVEMADYLCVDRSALSRELGKMRDEGLIDFDGHRFNKSNVDKYMSAI